MADEFVRTLALMTLFLSLAERSAPPYYTSSRFRESDAPGLFSDALENAF